MSNQTLSRQYEKAGFTGRVGFGKKPALLIVDFQKGFTDPSQPLGGNMDHEIKATASLLELARTKELLIAFTVVAYEPGCKDGGRYVEKVPTLKALIKGTPLVEVDNRLQPRPGEHVLTKKFMSAFFGTNLASLLMGQGVDTLIITGCVTSACIRASATDSMQFGLRTILPLECITDRAQGPHEANLFDINAKMGDVVPLQEVVDYLNSQPQSGSL